MSELLREFVCPKCGDQMWESPYIDPWYLKCEDCNVTCLPLEEDQ